MKKLSLSGIIALGLLGSVSCIQANELEVSGNIGATSNYLWRGMTQTQDKSSVNGGVDLGYKGFYTGAWASNVDFQDEAEYELDLYVGYANSIGDFSYDLSYLKFLYPSESYDFDEATLALGYTLGDLSLGVSHSIGTYTENDGDKNDYTEATASYDLKVASLDLSYGDYDNFGDNYTVGVSKSFELEGNALDLALVYANFDADSGESDDEENVFATITYSF